MKTARMVVVLGMVVSAATGVMMMTGCGGDSRDAKCPSVATSETTSARGTADANANKALVKRYLDDVWSKKDPDAVPKYVAADLVNHSAIPQAQGAAGLATIARKLQKAFPDLTMTVSSVTADDDLVVVRAAFEGTHAATLEFQKPLEPTNKHVKVDQVHTMRVKDGHIVEMWMVMDKLDLMTQLGVIPPR